MYDRNIQIRNLSQGYTMKETLEMLIDLFDICFDSDGANDWMIEQIEEKGHASDWNQYKAVHKLYDELKNKLDDVVRIKE
jgi:hypothetical protein